MRGFGRCLFSVRGKEHLFCKYTERPMSRMCVRRCMFKRVLLCVCEPTFSGRVMEKGVR